MSASHRSISRIPLHVFQNLIHFDELGIGSDNNDPEKLRHAIISKFQRVGVKSVGDLLHMSQSTLLRSLSPLLTNGEQNNTLVYFQLSFLASYTHHILKCSFLLGNLSSTQK